MPTVKDVGEPCAGEPHARFDGGREETGASRLWPRGAWRLPPTLQRPLPGARGIGQVCGRPRLGCSRPLPAPSYRAAAREGRAKSEIERLGRGLRSC